MAKSKLEAILKLGLAIFLFIVVWVALSQVPSKEELTAQATADLAEGTNLEVPAKVTNAAVQAQGSVTGSIGSSLLAFITRNPGTAILICIIIAAIIIYGGIKWRPKLPKG